MFLPDHLLKDLETPCIVIDVEKAKRNIAAMQAAADRAGVALRPHIKTHKMPFFARLQVAAGAKGITCAKISEAEVMAEAGLHDIFVAYPMVGAFRIRRAVALAQRLDRLILAVDSFEGATALSNAAVEAGASLEIRLEVDTGAMRTGISMENALKEALRISALPGLSLTGIYTFKGLVLHGQPTQDREAAALEEGQLMDALARYIRAEGIPLADVSAGSTPTGIPLAKTGLVNEIRPGTYIFNDYMLYKEGAATLDEIAARIYATVVSTPKSSYAVIDGGTKTFPMDIFPGQPPFYYPGYAVFEDFEELRLTRMNEEHGMLTSTAGATGLVAGQVLALLPIHICTTINLQNQVYLYENGVLRLEKVAARGMLA